MAQITERNLTLNGFTADDYSTAARVLREHNVDTEWPAFFEKRAQQLKGKEAYVRVLGRVGIDDLSTDRGEKILQKLEEDGWTPPDGLF